MVTKSSSRSLNKFIPYLLIVVGVLGLLASFVIMYDKIQLLQDPNYKPGCSLNPVISCGSVMQSEQANTFGFANPFLGLAGFPMLLTVGVAMLAGARFKKWFWQGLQVGALFGLAFVHYLFFESVYRIGALCPYCMLVWIITITTFWYVLLYNLGEGNIKLPARFNRAEAFAQRHHLDILVIWLLIIAGLILHRFWYFFNPF
jgi:Predicted membrane protein